jgi:hypothetical protein
MMIWHVRVAKGFAFSQQLARVLLNTFEAKNWYFLKKKLENILSLTLNTLKYKV